MISSKYLLKVLIVVAFGCLVAVECRYPPRRRMSNSERQNLWIPDQSSVPGGYSNNAMPRFDYDTGLATGIAMKKALGLTKIVLSPIVLPMIFFVGVTLLVFFAVVGSSAVVGGSLGRNRPQYRPVGGWGGNSFSSRTAKLASDVLNSDQCIERISCEVFREAKSFGAENFITSAIQEMPSSESLIGRISRSIKNPANCQQFGCKSLSLVSRAVKAFQG